MKRESEGEATAMTITSSAMTRISSMSVKAHCPGASTLLIWLFPVRFVIVASHASVRPHRHQVVPTWVVFAGALVEVRVAPRVERNLALHIRAFPILRVPRWMHQIDQPVLALRIVAHVHLERVQRGPEGGDLRYRGRGSGLLGAAREFRNDNGGEDAQ